MAAETRFYFGERLGSLTLSQLRERQAFLYNDGTGSNRSDCTNRLASAATALMSRTGRKQVGLGELMGAL